MKIAFSTPFKPLDLYDLLDDRSKHTASSRTGVNAPSVSALVRQLHENDHELSIYSLDPTLKNPLHLEGPRLSVHLFPKRRARHCMLDCYGEERSLLSRAIKQFKPDIISAQWSYEHAVAAIDTGIPTVVTCHDTPLRCAWHGKNLYMMYHLMIAWRAIRSAQHLIAVSPYTAKHIRSYFWPTAQISVVPNGLPDQWLEENQYSHRERKLDHSKPIIIVSIGGWGKLKNIARLLEANKILRTQGVETKLVLYGSGLGPNESAHNWAKKRGVDDGVEFRGAQPRDKIMECLADEADLLVHPSKVETHGMALIEAMSRGVPVIGGQNSGAVPWTLDHGKSGLLCDIKSAKAISNCIQHAINNPDEMREIAEHAWGSIKERFRISVVAEAHEAIFADLLKQ